jgi:hypothetical protein
MGKLIPQNKNIGEISGHMTSLIAGLFIFALFFSFCNWIYCYRSLFGDGSNLLLAVIRTRTFFHVSATRSSATFISQLPVVLAIHFGCRSITILIMLYTFGLSIVPTLCYSIAIWISRCDPISFGATAIVILVCYYPMSFLLVGEANIYLALFWLSFVLLILNKVYSLEHTILLLILSIAAIKAYEISMIFSLILATLTAFRSLNSNSAVQKIVLLGTALLFGMGAWFGLSGALYPRDPANEADFGVAIERFWENGTLESIFILTSITIASSFVTDKRFRIGMAALVAVGFITFSYSRILIPTFLALGYPLYQRAQAFIITAGITFALLLAKWSKELAAPHSKFFPLSFIIPLAAIVSLDTIDTWGQRTYFEGMCLELMPRRSGQSSDFFEKSATQKYGWGWTFPIVSALLRPPGSHRTLMDPTYHGWLPLSNNDQVKELNEFKKYGSFCNS